MECSAESQPKVAQRASEARQIDNNGVENAIRPTAIGKKNWLFFGDAEAGQRSAVIYTIIESCRRRGIDPHAYLRDVLTRITESTNWNVADLTPQKWAKTEKGGVGAVSVVAFTYDIYTIPSQNNGVLGATLTMQMSAASFQSAQFSVAPARGSDRGNANECSQFSVSPVFSRASAGVRSRLAGIGGQKSET